MDLTQAYALLNAVQFAIWYTPKDRTGLECLTQSLDALEEIGRGLDESIIHAFMNELLRVRYTLNE